MSVGQDPRLLLSSMTLIAQPRPPPRLLIVDDDVDYADAISELLRLSSGWTVDVACSSRAGLLKVQAHCPDAVLMDMDLSGESGFDAADKLRQALPMGHVCFVAVTGDSGLQWLAHHDARFAEAFLKPVDSDAVLTALCRILGRTAFPHHLQ